MASYLINMQLEVVTDDGETVKDVRIHGIENEPVPLPLWCDFLERISKVVSGGSVLFVSKRTERKPLVEVGKGYIITKTTCDCATFRKAKVIYRRCSSMLKVRISKSLPCPS